MDGGGFDSPEGMIALRCRVQILGLTAARSTPNALPRAALAVMDAPLTEGYSAFMLEQRLSLIDEAVAVLKDEDAEATTTRTLARVFSPRSSPSARRRRSAYFKRLENTKPS